MRAFLFSMVVIGSLTWCQAAETAQPVSLKLAANRTATLSNGLITVSIDADGSVKGITSGSGNLITASRSAERGYFSFVTDKTSYAELDAKKVDVVRQTDDIVELRYSNTSRLQQWSVGYIMRRGVSGLYTYAILRNTQNGSQRDNRLNEARIVWRVNPDIFNYAWVSDSRHGTMPSPSQMKNYVEEVQDATYRLTDGSVYTKYDWASFVRDDQLHGLMGATDGIWLITPSAEWINGGVQKQELTVHATDTTPLILQMFHSMHLGADAADFGNNQQKLYGPGLIYVNSGSSREAMAADAKRQAAEEVASWPYAWFSCDLYPQQRATVSGRIRLRTDLRASKMQVVLAEPGANPMAQGTGYQFWTETDGDGRFTIPNVRPGSYAVHAYALDGEATGRLETPAFDIVAGNNDVGDIAWNPDKYAETLWRIGEADHTTQGFCLSDHVRQYGLWTEPPADLTYTVGSSNPSNSWYYAQSKQGTWSIKFNTDKTFSSPLHLTIATAGMAGKVKIEVKMNSTVLKSIQYGNDASVYRSAVLGGRDSVVVLEVPASAMKRGANTLNLKLWNMPSNGLGGVMYDCIKLEAGAASTPTAIMAVRHDDDSADAPVYDLMGRKMGQGALPRGIYVRQGRKFVVR